MQYRLRIGPKSRLPEIQRRLRVTHGSMQPYVLLDPVSQLILALLGCRTPNEVSMEVFEDLCRHFERWEDLRDAPVGTVREIIRPVTYSERKATWLVSALSAITRRRGSLDLDFLADWRTEAARNWLESLPGVGPKVSAAVLNFSRLRMRALVADTHHLRVAKRLGILPHSARAERAYRMLMDQVPEAWISEDLDDHNTLMKKHGQAVCRHANPACSSCALRRLCPSSRCGEQRSRRHGHLH